MSVRPTSVSDPGPTVRTEIQDRVLLVSVGGAWSLYADRPSWRELEPTGVRSVRVVAEDLRMWDTSLLLFLHEARTWSREVGAEFEAASLPTGLEKLFAKLVSASGDGKSRTEERRPAVLLASLDTLNRLGRGLRDVVVFTGELAMSVVRCLLGRRALRWKECLLQMRLCGAMALPIVSLISFLVGTIMAFQAAVQLRQFGAGLYVVDLVDLAIAREMGPVMAGIVVSGRTGSAFAAHLGSMVVGEEVDALRTFAISPFDFLVLPRVLALFLMMPVLTLYADAVGIAGGLLTSITTLDIPPTAYWNRTTEVLALRDVGSGLLKSVVFALLIGCAGCLRGLQTGRSAASIGRASTSAVVTSILLVIAADALFAQIFDAFGI